MITRGPDFLGPDYQRIEVLLRFKTQGVKKWVKNGSTLARAPAHQIYRDYVRYIRAYGTGRFSVVS